MGTAGGGRVVHTPPTLDGDSWGGGVVHPPPWNGNSWGGWCISRGLKVSFEVGDGALCRKMILARLEGGGGAAPSSLSGLGARLGGGGAPPPSLKESERQTENSRGMLLVVPTPRTWT